MPRRSKFSSLSRRRELSQVLCAITARKSATPREPEETPKAPTQALLMPYSPAQQIGERVYVFLNVRMIWSAFQLGFCRDVSGCLWHSLVVTVLLDFCLQEFSRVLHTFGTDTSNCEERRCVSRDAVPLAFKLPPTAADGSRQ